MLDVYKVAAAAQMASALRPAPIRGRGLLGNEEAQPPLPHLHQSAPDNALLAAVLAVGLIQTRAITEAAVAVVVWQEVLKHLQEST